MQATLFFSVRTASVADTLMAPSIRWLDHYVQACWRGARNACVSFGIIAARFGDAPQSATLFLRGDGANRRAPTLSPQNLERVQRYLGIYLLHVVSRDIDSHAAVDLPEGFLVRLLSEEEACAIARDPSLSLAEDFTRRFYALGAQCVAAFEGSRVVGYSWIGVQDSPYLEDVMVRVPHGSIYRFKSFVRPEYRGRRISAKLYVVGASLARAQDHHFSFALIASHNISSFAASRAAGRRRIGWIVMFHKGGMFLAIHSAGVRNRGIRLYAQARAIRWRPRAVS